MDLFKWTCVDSVEKRKILSHQKNISSNQLFSNLFINRYFPEIFAKNAWERIQVHNFNTVILELISRIFPSNRCF